ncbi:MAG TPA: hypothetical protein VF221_06280 [Chloroflexota bacterium]
MKISAIEGELLVPEIRSFAGALHDETARARYEELRVAVEDGEVGDELIGHLGNVLEIGLQSGRLRRFYGADGEATLARVFRRTPSGVALSEAASDVTHALTALHGQNLEDIQVSALGPGSYGLTIDTDRCQINLRLDRSGVRVENVAIGI